MAVDDKFVSRILLVGLAIAVLIFLIAYFKNSKGTSVAQESKSSERYSGYERFSEPQQFYGDSAIIGPSLVGKTALLPVQQHIVQEQATDAIMPSESLDNEDYKAIDFSSGSKLPIDCFPRDRLTAEDLLPKDAANSKWAQVNPAGQGDVKDQNFLTASYLTGINTVGQTLRNANYQLRSEPLNPRFNVGPWNQTTIEGDSNRKYFEISEC